MIGLADKSIVMDLVEAKKYVQSRIMQLSQEKEELLNELDAIDAQISQEMEKLHMLNNPPSPCECCDTPVGVRIVERLPF